MCHLQEKKCHFFKFFLICSVVGYFYGFQEWKNFQKKLFLHGLQKLFFVLWGIWASIFQETQKIIVGIVG